MQTRTPHTRDCSCGRLGLFAEFQNRGPDIRGCESKNPSSERPRKEWVKADALGPPPSSNFQIGQADQEEVSRLAS